MTSKDLSREAAIRKIQDLLLFNIQMLVQNDEKIQVEATDHGPDKYVSLTISVHEGDAGRVIGTRGKTLGALRTILICASTKLRLRARLE
jgi:predicted RNA-binding protein YlqC (UPF0109 family)